MALPLVDSPPDRFQRPPIAWGRLKIDPSGKRLSAQTLSASLELV